MKIYLLSLLMFTSLLSVCQEVYIENGKILTNFKFETSQGVEIDYLRETIGSMGFGFRAPFDFTGDRLYLGGGLSLNGYGASGTDVGNGNTYAWDVNYLAVIIGTEYDVVAARGFKFFAKGQLSSELFLQGTQTINGENFDLKGEEQFDGTKIFFRVGGGISYTVNDDVAAYIHYMVGRNFFNVGEDKSDGQDLDISTHSIGLGVLLRLKTFSRFK